MTREKRMGVLGLPLGHASHDHCDLLGEKAAVPVAVVVPGLLSGKTDQLHDAAEERLQLHALLRCIHGQTEMPPLVILVDDDSPTFPSVAHLRQEMHGSCSCSIRLLTVKNAVNLGPAAARNKGIDTAVSLLLPHSTSSSGLLIFLTDLDCIPTSTWIEEGQQHWLRSRRSTAEAMLLGGFTLAARPPSIFGHFHDAFGTLNPRILAGKPLYAPSCNMAIYLPPEDAQQQQLCKFPRFDESFKEASMEDVLFCLESSARRGVEFQLAPRMVVEHVYTSSTAIRWATWEGPDVFGAVAGWNLFLCFCSGLCAIFRQFRKYGRWERASDVRYPAYAGHHLTKSLELPSPVTPLVNL